MARWMVPLLVVLAACAPAPATPTAPAAAPALAPGSSWGCRATGSGPLVVTLAGQTVPLADPGGQRRMTYSLALELGASPTIKTGVGEIERQLCPGLNQKLPDIERAAARVLASKTSTELLPVEGKERAKAEIAREVQAIVGASTPVRQLYFTELVIR